MAQTAVSGIYEIVNLKNGKRYIGSAVNLALRWRQHRCELGKRRHNRILQNAWNKYGPNSFEFRIVEFVPDKHLLVAREQHYLDTLAPAYNCAAVAGSNLGVKHGSASREKISKAHKGLWADPVYRAKMSSAHTGKTLPPEVRAKLSEANRGRKLAPDHAKQVAAMNAVRNKSPEHRALVSARWTGRVLSTEHMEALQAGRAKRVFTAEQREVLRARTKAQYENGSRSREKPPEVRAKIAASLSGRKLPPEVIAKLKLRKHSEETRQKMTESQKRRWVIKKAAVFQN